MGSIGTLGIIGSIGTMENGKIFFKNFDEFRKISIGTIEKNTGRNDEFKAISIGTLMKVEMENWENR